MKQWRVKLCWSQLRSLRIQTTPLMKDICPQRLLVSQY